MSACVLGDDCAPQQLLLYAPAALARRLFQHEADAAPCCFLLLTACVLLPAAQPDAVEKWRRHFALDPKRKWRQVQISAGGDGFCLRPHATSLIQIGAANRSAWEGFHRSHRGQNKILKAGRKKKKRKGLTESLAKCGGWVSSGIAAATRQAFPQWVRSNVYASLLVVLLPAQQSVSLAIPCYRLAYE